MTTIKVRTYTSADKLIPQDRIARDERGLPRDRELVKELSLRKSYFYFRITRRVMDRSPALTRSRYTLAGNREVGIEIS